MKKIVVFAAAATLVVSAAAVVGVKVYNYYSMPELMKANLEALSQDGENPTPTGFCYIALPNGIQLESLSFCNTNTNNSAIYPCPKYPTWGYTQANLQDRCTTK